MNYWEQQEQERLRKENAWLDDLNPMMRMIDDHLGFLVLLVLLFGLAVFIGLLIGWFL